MISKTFARNLIGEYKEAWEKQDTDKITNLFTENGKYYVDPHEKPFTGRESIANYWRSVIKLEERDIKFKAKKIFIDGNSVIIEWEAKFYKPKKRRHSHVKGIMIFEIKDGKIKTLREYWHSKHMR